MLRRLAFCLGVFALLTGVVHPASAAEPFRIIVPEPETPLAPNSVIDLALQLGYYAKAGVDVQLVRVQATPSAIAALRSGQGEMANVGTDIALQLIARDQMKLRGVISPDKALPYVIVAKDAIADPKALAGKIFGVGQIGSVDYVQSRAVLSHLGVDRDLLRYVPVGQPMVRAQALIAGTIDATTMTLGTWLTLPNHDGLHVLLDERAYYAAAPLITKLNVVTEETARARRREVEAVVRAIVRISRDFARDPGLWVEAMAKARPDVPRAQLEVLAKAYADGWSVDGGLDEKELAATTDALYRTEEFKSLPRRVEPTEWIDREFLDIVLRDLGTYKGDAGTRN
jgi:NitT/TauT family transport system substrate-binding protein